VAHAHRVILAGLASVLYLGGWAIPALSPATDPERPVWLCAGALLLLAKTWAVVEGAARFRRAFSPPPRAASAFRSQGLALCLALGSLGATALWLGWGPPPAVDLLVRLSLLVVLTLGVAALAHRVRFGLRARRGAGLASASASAGGPGPGREGRLRAFL
jgi:hypothetical protein